MYKAVTGTHNTTNEHPRDLTPGINVDVVLKTHHQKLYSSSQIYSTLPYMIISI